MNEDISAQQVFNVNASYVNDQSGNNSFMGKCCQVVSCLDRLLQLRQSSHKPADIRQTLQLPDGVADGK